MALFWFKTRVLPFIFFIGISFANCQEINLNTLARKKYVEQFTEYYFIWPVVKHRSTDFVIQSTQESQQKLTFRPNVSYHAGAGVYMFGIGIQILIALPASRASIQTYGKSRALDLQLNAVSEYWLVDIFTQNYKGYYRDKGTPGVPILQRPDIRTWNTGIIGSYFFDKRKFSIRSTINYYERQLKSAGSFLISGNINTFSLHADSSIYPSSAESIFGHAANFQRADYTTIAIAPGYAYNFVFDNYFVGGAFAVGPAMNWLYYQVESQPQKSSVQLKTYVDLRLSAGYNSERFFIGAVFTVQSRNIQFEGVTLTSSNDVLKIAMGYRFREKGIMKKRLSDLLRPKVSG